MATKRCARAHTHTHKTGQCEIKKDTQVLMTRTTLATYRFRRTSHRRFRLCRNRVVQRGFGCHGDTVGPNQDSREGDQVLYEFHDGNCRRSALALALALLKCRLSSLLSFPKAVSSFFLSEDGRRCFLSFFFPLFVFAIKKNKKKQRVARERRERERRQRGREREREKRRKGSSEGKLKESQVRVLLFLGPT